MAEANHDVGQAADAKAAGTSLPKGRVEALTDGVFAVAMTLLVLDIKVPIAEGMAADALPHHLMELWPHFMSYGVSFIMLGVYWVGHHNQFHVIRRADRPLLWINILFMMFIALLPFSTALLSHYPGQPSAIRVYGGNVIVIGLVLYWHFRHATHGARLVDNDLNPDIVRLAMRRILIGPALFLIAVAVANLSATVSIAIYALTPLIYILPGKIDRHWRQP